MSYKGRYKCHSCGVGIEILVETSGPPTHACPKRLKKVYELEKIEDAKTGNRKRRQSSSEEVS